LPVLFLFMGIHWGCQFCFQLFLDAVGLTIIASLLPMILVRNQIRNMLGGETGKITFGRINYNLGFGAKEFRFVYSIRGGADKTFARPGRKQATATKLGIYSTYSPRSSIHFLALCSNFCKPLKKKKTSEDCPSNQVSAVAMTSASDEKWWPFNCFSVQRTGGSPTGPDPETSVGD